MRIKYSKKVLRNNMKEVLIKEQYEIIIFHLVYFKRKIFVVIWRSIYSKSTQNSDMNKQFFSHFFFFQVNFYPHRERPTTKHDSKRVMIIQCEVVIEECMCSGHILRIARALLVVFIRPFLACCADDICWSTTPFITFNTLMWASHEIVRTPPCSFPISILFCNKKTRKKKKKKH